MSSRVCATAEAAEQAFYAAMAKGDLDLMMGLWADEDGAICNHPGGPRLIGIEAIRSSFRDIFSTGGIRIATSEVHAFRTADVAVHSLIERIAVEGRGGSEVIEVIATNVFVRRNGHWLILVHHAGVFDSADESDADEDFEDTDDGAPARFWSPDGSRPPRQTEGDGDEDGMVHEPDPLRPPPGRLH
jgi:uncharacterized protein (TIGR02246 family)